MAKPKKLTKKQLAEKAIADEAMRLARVMPDQDYICVVCINCGSGMIRTTRSEKITDETRSRHHKCTIPGCNREWNSLQTIPMVDRDSTDKTKLFV